MNNYTYIQTIADHQGNIRVNFQNNNGTAELIQEDHYYPFGLTMGQSYVSGPENYNLYSSKEWKDQSGEQWYDFGFRNYDAALGRWFNPDAFAESYGAISPYNYCLNDPINYIDPLGLFPEYKPYRGWVDNEDDDRMMSEQEVYYWFLDYGYSPEDAEAIINGKMGYEITQTSYTVDCRWIPACGIEYGGIFTQQDPGYWKVDSWSYTVNTYSYQPFNPITIEWAPTNADGVPLNGPRTNDDPPKLTIKEFSLAAAMLGANIELKQQLFNEAAKTASEPLSKVKYVRGMRTLGIAGYLFGMGVSGYNIYNDYSNGGLEAVNGWDVADFGVGAAGLTATVFLVSNPVGWVISGGAAIYFLGRTIYDLATDD